MLELVKTNVSEKIIVTLSELATLNNPYFLFICTHTETKEVVKFIRASAADESLYTYRYNKFEVNPSVLFLNKPRGFYNYIVYEQASAVNLDPTGLNAIEYGKLILKATELEFDKYEAPVTYKAYDG
jgi:hypothetical protein